MISPDILCQIEKDHKEKTIKELLIKAEENWHKDIPQAKSAAIKAFNLLNKDIKAEVRAEAYAQKGISFYTELNYDSAIYYYEKATEIAVNNKLKVYRYLAITTSAMEKTGRFMDAINLIDEKINQFNRKPEELLNLLLLKLSASISIGLTENSDSILKETDSILQKNPSEKIEKSLAKLKGRYYYMTAQYEESDSIYTQLLTTYQGENNKMDIAETYLLLAQNAMEVSRFDKSSDFLIKSQAIYDSLAYEYGQANINLYTGTLLSWMGKYQDASEYIYKSLEVFKENNNRNEEMKAYYELGWIFYSMKMVERSKRYLSQALDIAQKISNINYIGNIHNVYGQLYTYLNKYDSALTHLDSAIYYHEITKNIRSISSAKFNKAIVLEKTGKKGQALELYHYSYEVDKSLQNIVGLIEGEWILGQYFYHNNNFDSAKYYYELGEKNALKIDEKYFLHKIYRGQAELNSDLNNYKKSNQFLEKSLDIQEELFNENKTLELATLETAYDLKNKEKELALLNLQKKNNEQTIALNQKTIESQRNTLIVLAIGIVVLLILSYVIFRYLKIRTKTNHQLRKLYNEIQEKQEEIIAQSEELKEANDHVNELNEFLEKRVRDRTIALENALSELDHFFYRASHDFRGPLTTLMGLVGVSKGYELPTEASNLFNKVNITVRKLDGMVKKLQAVSFLGDFDNLKSPQYIEIDSEIKRITHDVIESKSFEEKELNYEININTSIKSIIFYPVIFEICLSNLIENSLVFNNSEKVIIHIKAVKENNILKLSVQDNGIGISKEVQHDVFNMFKRTSQSSKGNGLGLYIVKKATEKLSGEIKFESNTRTGSIFTISFPLSNLEKPNKKDIPKSLITNQCRLVKVIISCNSLNKAFLVFLV
jgi:signal transduction histidine kinase/tetratricopeptide (TPR) repeat protein